MDPLPTEEMQVLAAWGQTLGIKVIDLPERT